MPAAMDVSWRWMEPLSPKRLAQAAGILLLGGRAESFVLLLQPTRARAPQRVGCACHASLTQLPPPPVLIQISAAYDYDGTLILDSRNFRGMTGTGMLPLPSHVGNRSVTR